MSLNVGLIALEGNHAADLIEFFGATGYRLAGVEWLGTKEAADALAQPDGRIVRKASYYDAAWTIIVDPELTLAADLDALAAFSREHDCRVCACICAGTAGSYGFFLCAAGQTLREIEVTAGVAEHNHGDTLKGEPQAVENLDETALLALFAKTVSPYDQFEVEREYSVYSLVCGDHRFTLDIPLEKKPWWKFW